MGAKQKKILPEDRQLLHRMESQTAMSLVKAKRKTPLRTMDSSSQKTATMITQLTSAQLDLFIRIRQDSLQRYPLAFGADPATKLDRTTTERDLAAKDESNFILGYWEKERLVGIIGFIRETRRKKQHKGWIWGMFVYPEYQGKGIGKALLTACLERAAQLDGLEKVLLSVTSTAAAALSLYQALGFEAYGTERRAMIWRGQAVDEIFMEKIIDRK